MMYTDGAQCTANFVYTDGAGNTYVGYAAHCAGTGRGHGHRRLQHPVPPARHQGDLQRGRQPGRRGHPGRHRHARLQLLADHAEERREGHQHLRLQRPGAGQGRQRATPARSTPRSRSGAARPASTPTAPPPATGSTPTATPASAPASSSSSRTPARASATTRPTAAGRTRSTPSRPGIPGDSGSGFMSADGPALGVLSTRGARAARRVQRRRRPGQGAGLRAGDTPASPGWAWSTAPSRSRRSSDPRPSGRTPRVRPDVAGRRPVPRRSAGPSA